MPEPERTPEDGDDYVAIADAVELLGITRRELLHRLRLESVGDLRYEPARGGWSLPRSVLATLGS